MVVYTVSVIGNFERMVRIADGAVIQLYNFMAGIYSDIRQALDLDESRSRCATESRSSAKVLGRALRSVAYFVLCKYCQAHIAGARHPT